MGQIRYPCEVESTMESYEALLASITGGTGQTRTIIDPATGEAVGEARWKAGPAEERKLWQGLAQICVGLTHAARGNSVGALRLLERGAARLAEYGSGEGPTYGLDLSAVVNCARDRMRTGP